MSYTNHLKNQLSQVRKKDILSRYCRKVSVIVVKKVMAVFIFDYRVIYLF